MDSLQKPELTSAEIWPKVASAELNRIVLVRGGSLGIVTCWKPVLRDRMKDLPM